MSQRARTIHEPKNARALSVIKGWCRAVGIGYRPPATEGSDLSAVAANGALVQIQVRAADSVPAPEGFLIIDAGVITGRKIDAAFAEFDSLQSRLGYEPKTPVDRGPLPSKKLSYHDNFEDVAMRHTELRRVPNPDPDHLKRYERTAKKATWNFLRLNSQLCQDHMLEFDDLFSTYATMWTVVYIGYYEVPEEDDTDSNNEKKLYAYLWQRFAELRDLLWKKARSTLPNIESAALAVGGFEHPFAERHDDEQEEEDEGYVNRHCQLDVRSPNTRRNSADRILTESLQALPHDRLLTVLQETIDSTYVHPDARREAIRRLNAHKQGCTACVYLSVPALEEDE